MTIYLLWYRQSSGDFIIGIYDSLESAQNRFNYADSFDQRCMDIEEGILE